MLVEEFDRDEDGISGEISSLILEQRYEQLVH